MTKRADRRTGGFDAELERDPKKRYAARPDTNEVWTAAQEAVLVAAVCACRNQAAYLGMCAPLKEALGHPVTYPPGSIPHPSKHADTCKRDLELKIVSKMLAGYDGWTPKPPMGFHDHLGSITWGQKVKLCRPYHERMNKTHAGVLAFPQFLTVVGAEKFVVESYLRKLNGPKKFVDEEESGSPPVTARNLWQLRELIMHLDMAIVKADPIAIEDYTGSILNLLDGVR